MVHELRISEEARAVIEAHGVNVRNEGSNNVKLVARMLVLGMVENKAIVWYDLKGKKHEDKLIRPRHVTDMSSPSASKTHPGCAYYIVDGVAWYGFLQPKKVKEVHDLAKIWPVGKDNIKVAARMLELGLFEAEPIVWHDHDGNKKERIVRHVGHIRHMTLPKKCVYYIVDGKRYFGLLTPKPADPVYVKLGITFTDSRIFTTENKIKLAARILELGLFHARATTWYDLKGNERHDIPRNVTQVMDITRASRCAYYIVDGKKYAGTLHPEAEPVYAAIGIKKAGKRNVKLAARILQLGIFEDEPITWYDLKGKEKQTLTKAVKHIVIFTKPGAREAHPGCAYYIVDDQKYFGIIRPAPPYPVFEELVDITAPEVIASFFYENLSEYIDPERALKIYRTILDHYEVLKKHIARALAELSARAYTHGVWEKHADILEGRGVKLGVKQREKIEKDYIIDPREKVLLSAIMQQIGRFCSTDRCKKTVRETKKTARKTMQKISLWALINAMLSTVSSFEDYMRILKCPLTTPDGRTSTVGEFYAELYDEKNVKKYTQIRRLVEEQNVMINSALDVGCGTGKAFEALQGLYEKGHGIDINPYLIEKAREKGIANTTFEQGALPSALQKIEQSFDLVTAIRILHILNYQEVVETVNQITRVNPKLIIASVPSKPRYRRNLHVAEKELKKMLYSTDMEEKGGFAYLIASAKEVRLLREDEEPAKWRKIVKRKPIMKKEKRKTSTRLFGRKDKRGLIFKLNVTKSGTMILATMRGRKKPPIMMEVKQRATLVEEKLVRLIKNKTGEELQKLEGMNDRQIIGLIEHALIVPNEILERTREFPYVHRTANALQGKDLERVNWAELQTELENYEKAQRQRRGRMRTFKELIEAIEKEAK